MHGAVRQVFARFGFLRRYSSGKRDVLAVMDGNSAAAHVAYALTEQVRYRKDFDA